MPDHEFGVLQYEPVDRAGFDCRLDALAIADILEQHRTPARGIISWARRSRQQVAVGTWIRATHRVLSSAVGQDPWVQKPPLE